MSAKRTRIAVLGGSRRALPKIPAGLDVRHFKGLRDGGNGELRRLVRALKAGKIERLFLLARWNSHSVTKRVLRLCRTLSIPYTILDRSLRLEHLDRG